MPFVDDSALAGIRPNITTPPPEPARGDLAAAAFRQENAVVSVWNAVRNAGPFAPEEGHNPLGIIANTPYEANHLDRFLGSRSEAETRSIMGRIDQEEADRRVLAAGGIGGTLLEMLAGTLDPTIALPAGAVVKAGRGGYSLGRSAMSIGMAAAGQAALQETALQGSQETRTGMESAVSIGSATLLGSLLGAGAARLLSSVDRRALVKALDAERGKMDAHVANTRAAGEVASAERVASAQNDNAPLSANTRAAAAGAAAADTRRLELAPALGLEKAGIDPMSRTFNSESVAARRTMADLAETPLMFKENFDGIATVQGASLEREAKLAINGTRVQVADEFDRLFAEYRFGSGDVSYPRFRAQFERFTGGGDADKMTFADFKREVAKALQEGDRHGVPQVEQAARYIRQKVFDPWKDRAIKAGLLPEDVDVKTAESYFQRVYDKQKIGAQRPFFVNTVMDWLRSDQSKKLEQKQQLAWMNAQLRSWSGQVRKMEARLERLQAGQDKVAARLDERAMEVRRSEKRVDTLKERETEVADELTEIETFIREVREDIRDPALLARIDQLEADAAALRKADRPATEADLRRIEEAEVKGTLTGATRQAAEMLVGRRAYPKAPSFVTYLVANGGVSDAGGDLAHVIGGRRSRPGLLNEQGRSLDQWGEKLANEYPGAFPNGRPSPNEVLEFIDEAMRGRPPHWWVENMSPADRSALDAAKLAAAMDEVFSRAGIEVKSVRDIGQLLRDGRRGDVTLADLDKIAAEMEAAGEIIPAAQRRADVEERLAADVGTLRQLRATLADAIEGRAAAERRYGKATAVTDEATLGARANRGRLGVLQDRLDRAEARRELITDALEIAGKQRDELRGKIEEVIGVWEGKSAAEAKSAIKAREKYAAENPREDGSPRLTGADQAVDRAVRRIIKSDREFEDADLRAKAHEITDRILSSPDGRLPYDLAGGGPKAGVSNDARGALQSRDFNIPDELIRPWLDQDVERVVGLHLRTMVPDVLMAERFGDVNLDMPIRAINEEYAALADAARSEKERTRLEKQRQQAIGDIAAVRDRIRGVYGYSPDPFMRKAARTAQAIKNYNVISTMGSAAVTSLSDMAGPVFRNGFTTTLRDGWAPFFRMLTGDGEAWKAAARQYRAMGIVTETAIASRHHALDDILDLYQPQSRVESALQWGADKFQLANLLAPWTDWGKTTASVIAGAEILRASQAAVAGTASKRQLANLAASGIDRQMADRIWRQFDPAGEVKAGAIQDGVYLPNTGDWKDLGARQAFEGAIGREADIAIVTPGQEKPLWMSQPIVSVLGQFKSFTAAATQRVLMANLQRRDAAALQGLIFSVSLGMLSYRLNALFSGQPVSDRPQDWFKEGVSRSGVLGWLEEGNALASKMSRGGVDVYRLIGADKPLSRYASRSVLDQLLGPTVGKVESLAKVTGAMAARDWSAADTRALRRLSAFQNLFYVRRLFDQAEGALNGAVGAEALPGR